MVESERKFKQMTLESYTSAMVRPKTKMLSKQTKLTDFFPSKKPKKLFIINHQAHNNKMIVENKTRAISGNLVLEAQFPVSMETEFPDSEELIELKQDFSLKMIEICLGKMIEEMKPKKVEMKVVKPRRQTKLTEFMGDETEPIHLEEKILESYEKIDEIGMTADQILFLICLMIAMIFRGKIDRKKTVWVNRKMVLKTTFRSLFLTLIITLIPLDNTPHKKSYPENCYDYSNQDSHSNLKFCFVIQF